MNPPISVRSALFFTTLLAFPSFSGTAAAADKKSVILIAGKPSHGPGSHEHNAGVLLLSKCLKTAVADLVDVKVHLNAEWPAPEELSKADTVMIYADGFTGHPALQGDHLEQLRTQVDRGCGFMALHWATEVPAEKGGAEFLDWMGGFCEPFWSVNPHWTADFKELPTHPITSGVKPFSTLDEWYFHMRFRPEMKGVQPILTAIAPDITMERPDGMRSGNPAVRKAVADKVPQHVAWAAERTNGSRGFGFTGGHFHKGWANNDQRKLVLNAILWTANAKVPTKGVDSTVTPEELAANLDPKTPPTPKPAPPAASATPQPSTDPNPLLSPKDAIARMNLPKGFTVDLLASEPNLVQPIAYCWDERGRIWVVEGNTYPTRAGQPPVPRPDEDPHLDQLNAEETANLFGGKDRILIFSDEDGDGTYETRKVFMENLNLVSGIEVGFGGVYLGAAPYFLHVPLDASGDKPSGPPRVLADGFGWQDTHETLNSFVWGPDGWLYGCHGVFTQSKVRNCTGPAGPRARFPMNCAYWRWHPIRQEFELFAQGTSNPWGLDYNSKGQFFSEACVIPHFWHVIQGAYYLRQSNPLGHFNPYVYKNIETIADHAHFVGKSADRAFGDGGGHAHCGLALYDGNHFPTEYRNVPFLGNIHGKRLNNEKIIPFGSGYKASHAPDFLTANDFNFTAVTIKTAPDGSIVFSDWYDRQKCHSNNSEIWDRSNGRLYRVRYEGWKPWKATSSTWEPASTLELQLQENGWLSRMARKQIAESAAKSPVAPLLIEKASALLESTPSPETRLRLMWWLHATRDSKNPKRWEARLADSDPDCRLWAIQLTLEQGAPSPYFHGEMLRLAKSDPSPVVRLALCSALQRIDHAQRWDILDALLQHAEDIQDHNLPQMLWYALEPLVPAAPSRALALSQRSKHTLHSTLVARRIAELQTPESADILLKAVAEAKTTTSAATVLAALAEALRGRFQIPESSHWKEAYDATSKLLQDNPPSEESLALSDFRAIVGASFNETRAWSELTRISKDSAASAARRQRAFQTLASGRPENLPSLLLEFLSDTTLRSECIRQGATVPSTSLSSGSKGIQFFENLIALYPKLTPDDKTAAVLAMAGRAETARLLLEAVNAKTIPRTEVSVFAARQIVGLNTPALSKRLEEVWGMIRSGDKDEVAKAAEKEHARLKGILNNSFVAQADVSKGRLLFKNICGQCHQLFGEGGQIGPDLTGSNRSNLDYILENVTNPNAVIGKDYELHVFTLKDGRVISGMVRQETDEAFIIRTMAGQEQVAKADVKSEEKPGVSMMPAGLFSALPKEQMRDLFGYLKSPRQVPLPGENPATVLPTTVKGAIEGESLKILTAGLNAVPQKMGGFRDGVWSGDQHLWWRGGKVGDILELAVPVSKAGRYRLKTVLTRAPDYAVVRFHYDHQPIGDSVDLFGSKVTNTQELVLTESDMTEGEHVLGVEIIGMNPSAKPSRMFGLDYILLEPTP